MLLLSPGDSLTDTGSTLENESASGELNGSDVLESKDVPSGYNEMGVDFSKFPHLHLSEFDSAGRTPSPTTTRGILSPKRLWSTLRRNKSRSPLQDMQGEVTLRDQSNLNSVGQEQDERHGNWI